MLDIEFIRTHAPEVKAAAARKRIHVDIDRLLALDAERRATVQEIDIARQRRNELATAIPKLEATARPPAVTEAKRLRDRIAQLEETLARTQEEQGRLMLLVPSVPAPEVPDGETDEDNQEVRRFGEPRKFEFTPRDHVALARGLGLVDFDGPRGFAGSRSYALTGDGVLLEMAVLQFALSHVLSKGFTAVAPPVMVREAAMIGTRSRSKRTSCSWSGPARSGWCRSTANRSSMKRICRSASSASRLAFAARRVRRARIPTACIGCINFRRSSRWWCA